MASEFGNGATGNATASRFEGGDEDEELETEYRFSSRHMSYNLLLSR